LGEGKLVILVNNLNTVRHFVGANILCFKQIDSLRVLANFENPFAVDILIDAMDWLIGGHKP